MWLTHHPQETINFAGGGLVSKQTKLTKSARGRECTVRIPGVCNGNPETTVLAHLNGGGMGAKKSHIHGAYCCSTCHDELDYRTDKTPYSRREIAHFHLDGVIRTQEIMLAEGLIRCG